MTTLHLNQRASRVAQKGRPWFFADDVEGGPTEPGLVRIHDARGRDLGLGLWSPRSKLALRACGPWEGTDVPDFARFLDARLAAAIARRAPLAGPRAGLRLVHGESDGLPGLVVDRYADVVVVQVTSAALEPHTAELVELLERRCEPRMVLARNDVGVRALEGLDSELRLLSGRRVEQVVIDEDGVEHEVAPFTGHKTGFYLDQRPARAFVKAQSRGRSTLDVFSYQGAFSLAALAGGARSALAIDQSAVALERARRGAERNRLPGLETREANAFDALRELRRDGAAFELIVLDPPAFAKSRRELEGGLRGYRDLNRQALRLLAPGGLLVTCSCSHHVGLPGFEDVLRQAAAELPFRAMLRRRLGAGDDHPVWLALPESEYLKVLVVERSD